MDEFVVTCVQQQIRVFESHGEFRSDIQRFMRLAKVKDSSLVVFPELSGLMLAPPLVPGLKRTLLRVAERQVKRKPSIFDRMVGRMAGSASDMMGGIAAGLLEAFTKHADTLREAYLSIFSDIARENEMYVVGGTIYLPDPADGQMRNTAYLFSPTGEVIGQQSKLILSPTDAVFCRPDRSGLQVFDTDLARIGILIGHDALLPESGRILAAQGATGVVHLVAVPGLAAFTRMKNAFAARIQENLLLGAQSSLVGKNILTQREDQADYVGRSSLLAPTDMTTRYTGLLAEVGSSTTDGVVSATWDLRGLYELREVGESPLLNRVSDGALREQIHALYTTGTLPLPDLEPSGGVAVWPSTPTEPVPPIGDASSQEHPELAPVAAAPDGSEVGNSDFLAQPSSEPDQTTETVSLAGAAEEPGRAAEELSNLSGVPASDERVWPELNEFAPEATANPGADVVEEPEEPLTGEAEVDLPTAREPEADIAQERPEENDSLPGSETEPWPGEATVEPRQALLVVDSPDIGGDKTEEQPSRMELPLDDESQGETHPDNDSGEPAEGENEATPRRRRWWEL